MTMSGTTPWPEVEPTEVEPTQIDVSTLDAHEIVRRLGLPVGRQGPWHLCPVCNYASKNPGIGPHIMGHWAQLGISSTQRPKGEDTVFCPDCDRRTKRRLLNGHLRTHGHERGEAVGISRVVGFDLDTARTASLKEERARLLESLPDTPDVEQPVDRAETISATDAALAVIMSQTNGSIPIGLLPDIVEYIDATRRLAERLNEITT